MSAAEMKSVETAQMFGINAHRPDPKSPLLKLVADAGIRWVRLDFDWDFIEPDQPEPDKGNLNTLHDMVNLARALGLNVFATLSYTPAWANGEHKEHKYPPQKAQDWHDFVARTVQEFQNDIQYWGMWNEPNLEQYWRSPDVAKYVKLVLEPGSAAVKTVNKSLMVVAPDLACTVEGRWWEWIKQIAKLGADKHFDIFACHIYNDAGDAAVIKKLETDEIWADVADKSAARWQWLSGWGIKCVDEILIKAGQGKSVRTRLKESGIAKPLWLTEVGWDTSPEKNKPSDPNMEKNQATYYAALCRGVAARADWLHKVFFYELLESGDDKLKGIIRNDSKYTPKPAYYAYGDVIKKLVAGTAQ